ncbi:MAG TPA: hypothetical protein VIF02_02590, partial [Methylocella sp.]
EIDLRDGRYHRSEIEGIELVLKGWRHSDLADADLEARGILFFDGLYVALIAGSPGVARDPRRIDIQLRRWSEAESQE